MKNPAPEKSSLGNAQMVKPVALGLLVLLATSHRVACTFAWVGGFSSAPNRKPMEELIPSADALNKQLKLLYISCGNKDGLFSGPQRTHVYLKEHNIRHIWNVDDQGHDRETWSNNLSHFAQRLFR